MMDAMRPLVSILVVTHDRKQQLSRCLDSALAQTYGNKEVVVVNNGSSDGTMEMLAAEFPSAITVNLEENLGCPSGRNVGFGVCNGVYIYCLDDDGWLQPDAVEKCVRLAEENESIGVVMSRIHEVVGGGVIRKRPVGLETATRIGSFSGGCSLMRKAMFGVIGLYPEDFFRQAEEEDMIVRMVAHGFGCCLEPASVMYHAPSKDDHDQRQVAYYMLRNTNKTAVRMWPFPWCVLRIILNGWYTARYAMAFRSLTFASNLACELARDLRSLRQGRRPITASKYLELRRIRNTPAPMRSAGECLAPRDIGHSVAREFSSESASGQLYPVDSEVSEQ